MGKVYRSFSLLLSTILLVFTMGAVANAAPTLVSPSPNSFGEIERITLDTPADVYSGGVMVVGGVEMILPKNLLIDLPANRLSLQQIFDQAPAACKAQTPPESGLAKADKCNASGSGGIATLSAVRTNAGNVIVGDLFIQKAAESVVGVVSYINYDQGYYRVNGITNDPNTGAMVRLNDPTSRHTIQSGAGCAGGPNCSPDPRFTLDPDNYTNTFSTGYPVCIPSTVSRNFVDTLGLGTTVAQSSATGAGDVLCPDTNRSAALLEPAVADSRRFAPVKVGDSVVAEGNYETVGGVRFLSAHTSTVQKALATRNAAGQPDYLFLEEVGMEAPPYQNQRLITLMIGFTTLAPTDVDVWSVHRDPVNNAVHEFPLASVQGCDNASGGVGTCSNQGLVNAGANIFKIRHDVDFLIGPKPKLSPCAHLRASRFATSHPGICSGAASTAQDLAVLSPVPHEIIARTGHKIDSAPGSLITIDVNGNPATNGEYLFPLGLNLGGLGVAEMSEVDINMLNTPIPFEGIPWNLDRRLGPAGCLNGGCEAGAVGSAAFALDPFPFSGLDPRLQATLLPTGSFSDPVFNNAVNPLSNIRDRMFSYVDAALGNFNGNATRLPYILGSFPADPPLITINPTPVLNLFPPVALDDHVTTNRGVPVSFNVVANDIPILGVIDPATVTIVSSTPANGTLQINIPFPGYITYTPNPLFTGTNTLTYTVKNNVGAVSNAATVTVTIASPPVATDDTASATTGLQIPITVTSNDTPGTSAINTASVNVVSPATCGTVFNQANGTLLFTAPPLAGSCTFGYVVSDSAIPPQISNVATVTVTVTAGAASLAPVANNDTATATINSSIPIAVLVNDTATTSAINATTVTVTPPPLNAGTTITDPVTGIVTYTAPAVAGTYTFTYTVKDTATSPATSNLAIVTVTVTAPVIAPVANADAATLNLSAATNSIISVLANDTPAATLNTATVTIVTPPANGSAVVNPLTGAVTYTPNPGFVGPTNTFTYTVRDNLGVVSNAATVTVTVTAPSNETLAVARAEFQVGGASWRIEGTTTARSVGETMKIFNSATVPVNGTDNLLGTAIVDGAGRWKLTLNGPIPNDAQLRISILSSLLPTPAMLNGVTLVAR